MFFAAPRIDGVMALFEKRSTSAKSGIEGPLEAGREDAAHSVTGIGSSVKVSNLGKIDTVTEKEVWPP